ncbi:MAG: Dabb family protein [Chlorobium sp.]|jgi:quinol monooxygenase YgiN
MIKHIVMWRLKDNAHGNDSMTNAILIKDKLEALRDTIPGIAALEVGIDYSRSDSSSDVLLYSEFEDKDALNNYQKHPDHQALIPFIVEAVAERRLVDYEK